MRNTLSTTKEHYKSYKAGKRWLFACITVVSLGLGMAGAGTTAQADETSADDAATTAVQPASSSSQGQEQVLQGAQQVEKADTDVSGVKGDAEAANGATDVNDGQADKGSVNDDTPAPQADSDVNAGKVTSDNEKVGDPQKQLEGDSQQSEDITNDANEAPAEKVATTDGKIVNDDTLAQKSTTPDSDTGNKVQGTPAKQGTVKLSRNSLVKSATASIDGVDASVWMPDANLRAAVEKEINMSGNVAPVTDATLSANLNSLNSLTLKTADGMPTSLEGLQYFTNLSLLDVNGNLPADAWIDFGFAKNLSIVYIMNDTGLTGVDFPTFFKQTFGSNSKLMLLSLTYSGLTGNLPDITNYPDLKYLSINNNNLTGTLADLGSSTSVTSLMLGYNQMTGNLAGIDNLPNVTALYAANNNLSGDLTDLSNYTGTLYAPDNHLTSGVQNLKGYKQGLSTLDFQSVTGKTYTLTPKNREIDPVAGVITGVQDATGAIVKDDPMVVYKLGTAGQYFTVVTNSDGGFTLKAKGDVPDGDYTLTVINKKTYEYGVNLTFTVKNGEDPADPDTTNPDTKTPDTTTPETPNPDTTNPGGTTTTTPVTTVTDGGDADAIVAPADNESTTVTPLTGGDGATIDTTTPGTKSAGQADRVVTETAKQNGQPVSLIAKNSSRIVRGTKAPVMAHQPATASRQLAAKQTAETTLPQTNEQNSAGLIAAGVAVALATLGMGIKTRHN
ncbi:KxYKxGKxW signal peptide domain-containing protein [Levilactobacillus yiduensis]|uniref:KxYKxGKxW signal peptide domain-containing protein n=1 Tax=Levilactobacillus yiduensis TaxID=2953880 RepID=UPI000EF3310D|nr:KxYKxGKxW signal peptide domain-containing protein [Levilactobacillus yiduensis]AYM04060.1 LPXTG cell wall anchor domain-containing protein [Levilactobacillus brevis]